MLRLEAEEVEEKLEDVEMRTKRCRREIQKLKYKRRKKEREDAREKEERKRENVYRSEEI